MASVKRCKRPSLPVNNTFDEVAYKHRKRDYYNDMESSSDTSISHSIYNHTDRELSSCDSDIDEHDYCVQKKNQVNKKRPMKITSRNDGLVPKRPKCNSKNAVIARINRMKKKKYIEDIELKNAKLEEEKKLLKDLLGRRMEEVHSLERKTNYLRNVIRNHTQIGSLLKCIHQNTNLEISSSLLNGMSTNCEINSSDPQTSTTVNNAGQPAGQYEVFVAALVWGMALHTFCQPYMRQS